MLTKVSDCAVSRNPLRAFLAVFVLLGLALPQCAAGAETKYPSKPVRIVLPFAAGGVADITARIIADRLGAKLGRRFYIENQPGAGGIAAARTVISSPPDGYTLALLSNGTAISVSLFNQSALRSPEGFRADLEPRLFRFHLRDQRGLAIQDAGGFHRGRQGEARHAQCRHHQYRQHAEPVGGVVQDRGRHRFHRSFPIGERRNCWCRPCRATSP